MAVTPGGNFYIQSSDLVANYPATSLAIANRLDKYALNPYTDATERDFLIQFPVQGQLAQTLDDNKAWKYDGTAWVPFSGVSYTSTNPTFTNFTLGNGTARFKTVSSGSVTVGALSVTLDSTSVVSGDIRFLVTPGIQTANYLGTAPVGYFGAFDDSAANNFTGIVNRISGNNLALRPNLTNTAPYIINSLPTSSTVPFTWATGDTISATFYYENTL